MRVLRTPNKFIETAIAVEGSTAEYVDYRNCFPNIQFLEIANMEGSDYDMHFLIVAGERIVFYEKKSKPKKKNVVKEELEEVR
jgi:hypothetical protein